MRPAILALPLSTLLALTTLLAAGSAAASPTVDASGCPGLNGAEVSRLLELEVSTMAKDSGPVPAFTLELACAGGSMRMALFDPTTSKKLERTIPAPAPGEPGRERVVALAASQLLVASWLELLLPEQGKTEPAPPRQPSSTAKRVASRSLQPIRPPQGQFELGAVGGLAWRDLRQPMMLAVGRVAGSYWLSPGFGLRMEAGFEDGTADRSTGSVKVRVSSAGLGLGLRFAMGSTVDLEGSALGSVSYATAEGRPSSDAYRGKSASSITGDFSLRAGPVVKLGPARLGASACVGAMMLSPKADVAGDHPVRLGGGYFGVMIGAAWAVE